MSNQTNLLMEQFEVGHRVEVDPKRRQRGERIGVVIDKGRYYLSVKMNTTDRVTLFVPDQIVANYGFEDGQPIPDPPAPEPISATAVLAKHQPAPGRRYCKCLAGKDDGSLAYPEAFAAHQLAELKSAGHSWATLTQPEPQPEPKLKVGVHGVEADLAGQLGDAIATMPITMDAGIHQPQVVEVAELSSGAAAVRLGRKGQPKLTSGATVYFYGHDFAEKFVNDLANGFARHIPDFRRRVAAAMIAAQVEADDAENGE